jgi:hypothetical protein
MDKQLESHSFAKGIDKLPTSPEAISKVEVSPSVPTHEEQLSIPSIVPTVSDETELTPEQMEERWHTKEVREIMNTLTQLPRGLPTTLWGKDIATLASNIVDGPKKIAPDGTPLAKVENRWYCVDRKRIGTFLTEWREETPLPSKSSESIAEDRSKKLDKLEDALLEGKISEETYYSLKEKYDRD